MVNGYAMRILQAMSWHVHGSIYFERIQGGTTALKWMRISVPLATTTTVHTRKKGDFTQLIPPTLLLFPTYTTRTGRCFHTMGDVDV